jgi:hypothetical protein
MVLTLQLKDAVCLIELKKNKVQLFVVCKKHTSLPTAHAD